MTPSTIYKESETKDLLEKLAAIEHERWADWQRYCHAKGVKDKNGWVSLPWECVERWERQIATPYAELSEPEKQSDRDQVARYWPLIKSHSRILALRLIESLIEKCGTLKDRLNPGNRNSGRYGISPALGMGYNQALSDLITYLESEKKLIEQHEKN